MKRRIKGAPILKARITVAQARKLEQVEETLKYPKQEIRRLGLIMPKRLPPIPEGVTFPTNIRKLSHGEVRELMSFWTAYYGYANTQLGFHRARLAVLTRMTANRKAILFQKFKPEKKTGDWAEAIQGRIQQDAVVRKLEVDLAKEEGLVAALDALMWTYQRFADTASRDITARANEAERDGRSSTRIRRKGLHS